MTDISVSKSQLVPKHIAALVIAFVYALLNALSLITFFGKGGQIFYDGNFSASFPNLMWFLAPFGYIGSAIFILLRKPLFAIWLLLLPALSVLSFIIFGLIDGYGADVIPVISLKNFSLKYWSENLLNGTEFFAVVAIAILLLVPKRKSRGIATVSSNSQIGKSNFCPSCGSPAGEGDFCSKCGTNLGNPCSSVASSGSYTVTTTSTMAVVAFILSLFVPIVGLILGYISRKDIDQSGGRLTGRGFATAAIILNWIWIACMVIWVIAAATFASQL